MHLHKIVIPAKAGIQESKSPKLVEKRMDSVQQDDWTRFIPDGSQGSSRKAAALSSDYRHFTKEFIRA